MRLLCKLENKNYKKEQYHVQSWIKKECFQLKNVIILEINVKKEIKLTFNSKYYLFRLFCVNLYISARIAQAISRERWSNESRTRDKDTQKFRCTSAPRSFCKPRTNLYLQHQKWNPDHCDGVTPPRIPVLFGSFCVRIVLGKQYHCRRYSPSPSVNNPPSVDKPPPEVDLFKTGPFNSQGRLHSSFIPRTLMRVRFESFLSPFRIKLYEEKFNPHLFKFVKWYLF